MIRIECLIDNEYIKTDFVKSIQMFTIFMNDEISIKF